MKEEITVATPHPLYGEAAAKRKVYLDSKAGTWQLRKQHKKYLPKFPSESEDSYKERVDTLTHFNLTAKTVDVMTGLIFKDAITLGDDVNSAIVPLIENIDNEGTHLDVFARQCADKRFDGYCVILTDAPNVIANDLAEQRTLGLRPYLKLYDADSITGWYYSIDPQTKIKRLELLILREVTLELSNDFEQVERVRYREYRLINGVVIWRLWLESKDKNGKTIYAIEATDTLTAVSEIPAAVIGKLGGDPPLLDIAFKNIEHTQTYSDYKSIIHKTNVPMLFLAGVPKEERGALTVSGDMMFAAEDASASLQFAEVSGAAIGSTRESLQDIRDDISLLGLSLLADKDAKIEVTATEALLNNIGETAELRVLARELQDGLELSFGYLAQFLGLPKEQGGSLTLGAAWEGTEDASSAILPNGLTIAEFQARTEIVNAAEGYITDAEAREILFPNETEAERNAALAQLANERPVNDQNLLDDMADDTEDEAENPEA